jgi:hypothetical protein
MIPMYYHALDFSGGSDWMRQDHFLRAIGA